MNGKVTDGNLFQWNPNYLCCWTNNKITPPGASEATPGKQRLLFVYTIAKGSVHMAKQCTKPKRKRDETCPSPTMLTLSSIDDLDAYDSDCDELISAKIALIANLSVMAQIAPHRVYSIQII
ncbi:hypothetical protein Tco_0882477 [Tanacetum coccineum]